MADRWQTLVKRNQATPRRYEIRTAADEATVYLYDFIGSDGWGGGVSAQQFVQDLNAVRAQTIHLRINSPGGDVFDGRAIATAIRQHPSNVVAHVDGLAASAASFIALAADEVEMAPGAMLMIHRAWGVAIGNANDMLELAATLEKIDQSLVAEYVRETGNSADQVQAWLDAETWFTDEEAVQNGFADRIAEDATSADNRWDLSGFGRSAPQKAQAVDPPPPAPVDPAPAAALEQLAAAEADERYRRLRLIESESR